ncbi:hypothetical protein SDC9_126143 [bioreactor metagenome]|uniref:Uncharacterized protein n=1 Tax=bioreactor metagenome TaxID=1076179 RepID=A0A645CQW7_9ZZZZ
MDVAIVSDFVVGDVVVHVLNENIVTDFTIVDCGIPDSGVAYQTACNSKRFLKMAKYNPSREPGVVYKVC